MTEQTRKKKDLKRNKTINKKILKILFVRCLENLQQRRKSLRKNKIKDRFMITIIAVKNNQIGQVL